MWATTSDAQAHTVNTMMMIVKPQIRRCGIELDLIVLALYQHTSRYSLKEEHQELGKGDSCQEWRGVLGSHWGKAAPRGINASATPSEPA